MTLFERRVLAALFVLFLVLLPATLFLHHQRSVELKVIHPEPVDAR